MCKSFIIIIFFFFFKVFIHVSTAYSNCVLREIPEKVVKHKYNYKKMNDLINSIDDDLLDKITPQ